MRNCIVEPYSLEFNEGHLFLRGVIKMHFSFKVWCVNKLSSGDFTSPLLLCQDSLFTTAKYMHGK